MIAIMEIEVAINCCYELRTKSGSGWVCPDGSH